MMESTEVLIICLIIILWIVFGPMFVHDWHEGRKQRQYKIREH
jgi:hypothetical protein